MNDRALRTALVNLLTLDEAHVTVRRAVDAVRRENRHRRPPGLDRSVWELAEHLRVAQEDILRYTLDASWRSPEFPQGYWPRAGAPCDDDTWQRTVDGLLADLDAVVRLVQDPSVDLTAAVPHGEGRTHLRQVLLVADHNAYHAGQIVSVRRALGDWIA